MDYGWLFVDPCNVSGNCNLGSDLSGDGASQVALVNQVLDVIVQHAATPAGAQGLYSAWASAQGLGNASTAENLIIGGHESDSLSCVAIHDLATVPPAGMITIAKYNSRKNGYHKVRPLIKFKFGAWRLADCPGTQSLF